MLCNSGNMGHLGIVFIVVYMLDMITRLGLSLLHHGGGIEESVGLNRFPMKCGLQEVTFSIAGDQLQLVVLRSDPLRIQYSTMV